MTKSIKDGSRAQDKRGHVGPEKGGKVEAKSRSADEGAFGFVDNPDYDRERKEFEAEEDAERRHKIDPKDDRSGKGQSK